VDRHFKKGVELYNEADFRSAVVEFRRAYELSKNYKVLYNLAQTEYQLTNYVAALSYFEKYLAEGGSALDPTRRQEVEAEIPMVKSRIATVTIRTNVTGAAISVDDQSAGAAPLSGPLLMNPGSHRIVLRLSGYVDAVRGIEVGGGEYETVEVELSQLPVADAAPTGPKPQPSWTPAIIGWSATGVFAVTALVLGLSAQSESDTLRELKAHPNVSSKELSDADSKVRTVALLTDIALGATLASAGIATYFTVHRPSSSTSTGAVRVVPTLGGLSCAGTF
jgi:hypothetical protein